MLAGTRNRSSRRKGAALVEAAVVLPVFFSLLVGGVLLGVNLFRQQERGHMARGLTRWASLQDPGTATKEAIRGMIPPSNTAGFDPNDIEITVTPDGNKITVRIQSPKPRPNVPSTYDVTKTVWNPY